jgi:hypothetical protein
MNAEIERMREASKANQAWRKWGPYISDRQWGTVREDYSKDGGAWDSFSHDQARSRAYRWGEDGIGGLCDQKQILCFAPAFWNGVDPIIKERMFGLTNGEGNHGEDVKEYYFFLDNTPTHSYMKFLYKYPQAAFPYDDLVRTNRNRSRNQMEYELIDTGVFDQNRYFDVFIEYAKETPEDILIRITVTNRGPESARLHVLPTLWFRNTWSWHGGSVKPLLEARGGRAGSAVITASHPDLGVRYLHCDGSVPLLFTENETNFQRVFGTPNRGRYVKDGIDNFLVQEWRDKVNPEQTGTKACAHYEIEVPPGESRAIRLRLTQAPPTQDTRDHFGDAFDALFAARQRESDEFYRAITPPQVSEDAAMVMRQALAGMLWSKQYYCYDVDSWLAEHGCEPSETQPGVRNFQWAHMANEDIISMPDRWEYPWFAAWDLAFHCIALGMVDPEFAKQQIDLMLHSAYLHPNGQLPAYEWNFGDVNPPVHAWATYFIYTMEKKRTGEGDIKFLEHAFQKLLVNFTWWVNRKDPDGNGIFGGGFLGLDNIGVFDRSAPLPTGGHLEQADGTAWMAFFSQCMLQIATELAMHDPSYEAMIVKFAEHFLWIAGAMSHIGKENANMWDEEDGFFYDVLHLPDGAGMRLKLRSMVGLLPLCATSVFHGQLRQHFPAVVEKIRHFLQRHPRLSAAVSLESVTRDGFGGTRLLGLMDEKRYRRVLSKMLDENEFLSPYGIRSMSRYHLDHPYQFSIGGQDFRVQYTPAESDTGLFGGNSNWRGPIWMPVNLMIIRSLLNLYQYYGDDFKIECPTGSGKHMTLFEVSQEISNRLIRIFLRDEHGRRPVYGGTEKFQTDPHWKDLILFYEYFHGDNGAGIGASHQTGWTGVVARLIQMFAVLTSADVLSNDLSKIASVRSDLEVVKESAARTP